MNTGTSVIMNNSYNTSTFSYGMTKYRTCSLSEVTAPTKLEIIVISEKIKPCQNNLQHHLFLQGFKTMFLICIVNKSPWDHSKAMPKRVPESEPYWAILSPASY